MPDRELEHSVTTQCRNWLISHGWRPHRNHCGEFFTRTGTRLSGEKPGTPDWCFSRPSGKGYAQFLYVEMKSTRGTTRKTQKELIPILRHKGYTVIVAKSLESLKEQVAAVYAITD